MIGSDQEYSCAVHSNLQKVENVASMCSIHGGRRKEFISNIFKVPDISRSIVLNVGGEVLIVIKLKQEARKHDKVVTTSDGY